jgi:hypothetical protein
MTTTKFATLLAATLLLAGCSAAAEDATSKAATPFYGPGWRHEQMAQAWAKGETPGPMMMMQGRGYGPPMMATAFDKDGKLDTTKLPPWCPLNQTQKPTP